MSGASLLNRSWSGVALLLGFYLVVLTCFSLLSPWFMSWDNMLNIGANMAFIGLMCAAQPPLGLVDSAAPSLRSARAGPPSWPPTC